MTRAGGGSPAALVTWPRGDDVPLLAMLVLVVTASWVYLLRLGSTMTSMPTMPASMHAPGWAAWVATFVMWAIMMVAMMLPSALPAILVFTAVHRRRAAAGRPAGSAMVFALGYLLVWTGFSVVATTAQLGLHAVSLLSPAMTMNSSLLTGGILVLAGVFQWTPLKRACLSQCRSPLSFLMSGWREGRRGAVAMGARHGFYCLGCCWALMALLFVAGVMNILCIAVISLAVLLEKVAPRGDVVGRAAGAALILAGVLISR
jgi:predicted metal-binding membrane protein